MVIKASLHSEFSELATTDGYVNSLVPFVYFVFKVVSDLRAVDRQG